jgi:hypothetical protein
MNDTSVPGYAIRRLTDADAPGVARLVELIYGHTYYPTELYRTDEIIRLNHEGRLVSVVALSGEGSVVGHYALERPHLAAIAEASDAIVHPDHRHHHLMEEMRQALREEASRLDLIGIVGYPVTNHAFSQRADQHIGARPCGINLGLWPRTFHNMPEEMTQRMSFVIYFKYLKPPATRTHVVTRHQRMIAAIRGQWEIPVVEVPPAPPEGRGEITTISEPAVQTGTIKIVRVGQDTGHAIQRATRDLALDAGAKALTLELPLAQPGTSAICELAEEMGYYFAGLGPAFAADGDALLMQMPLEEIDETLLQIEEPFSRELLATIISERQRVKLAQTTRF